MFDGDAIFYGGVGGVTAWGVCSYEEGVKPAAEALKFTWVGTRVSHVS